MQFLLRTTNIDFFMKLHSNVVYLDACTPSFCFEKQVENRRYMVNTSAAIVYNDEYVMAVYGEVPAVNGNRVRSCEHLPAPLYDLADQN